MIKRTDLARAPMWVSALLISAAAAAQVSTPALESSTPAATSNTSRLILMDRPRAPAAASPNDFLPEHLREMLADPQLRQQEISLRMRRLRSQHPDFAHVLSIDANTEDKVLVLLADADLARDFRVFMLRDTEREQQAARDYDQLISEIARIIGTDKLDTYLDYDRTRSTRFDIRHFDATLPAASKLTAAQKDAMAPVLQETQQQQLRATWAWTDLSQIVGKDLYEQVVADIQQGGSQLLNISSIYYNEHLAQVSEATDQVVLERLSAILNTEQLRRYGEQQVQHVRTLHTRAQQLRRDAGAGLDLPPLPAPAPNSPVPNLQLQITLRINGIELARTLTSARGSSVSFDGPGGLQIEAQPVGFAGKQLVVELGLHEPAIRGMRLVGRALGKVDITSSQQPASPLPSHVGMLLGRKSYVIEARVSASLP